MQAWTLIFLLVCFATLASPLCGPSLGTLLIMAMMLLIGSDVVSRNLLGASLPGVIELVETGIVSIVFLQIAETYKSGKLMRSDGVIRAVGTKVSRIGLAVLPRVHSSGLPKRGKGVN